MEAVTPSKQRPPRLGRFAWERGARYCEEKRARLLWHFWRMIILESAFLCEMREWVEWEKKRERSLRYELGLLKSSPKVASSIRLGSKVKLGSRSSSSSLIRAKKTPDLFLLFLLKKNIVIFFQFLNVVEKKITTSPESQSKQNLQRQQRLEQRRFRRSGLFSFFITMQASWQAGSELSQWKLKQVPSEHLKQLIRWQETVCCIELERTW